jgi:multidrug efflux system outer membrane protein
MRMFKNAIPAAVVISALSACNLVPPANNPELALPATWRDGGQATAADIDVRWWRAFGSRELDRLIPLALAYNNDLAAAEHRVEQARAQAKIAGANLWPAIQIGGEFSGTHNSLGENRRKDMLATVAYELDLWGANRARRDAGEMRYVSESFARDALKLVVMADVGQAYFNLLAIAERKRIATEFLQNQLDVLTVVEARFDAGAVSAVDLAQQKTEVATARASLDLLVQQQRLAENALAILLGQAPSQAVERPELLAEIALPDVSPRQPVALLQRRPDIGQLDMQLKAANADVGIALAAFYPKLQLSVDALLANPQPAGLALTMAANLLQPLFQGGRLEGGLETAKARYAELVEIYQQTVLTALKEVEDASAVRSNSTRRMQALDDAVMSAEDAYRLARERYRLGAIDYQSLLTTQRTLLTAQNSRVQATLDVCVALVQLYKALGGGWQPMVDGDT